MDLRLGLLTHFAESTIVKLGEPGWWIIGARERSEPIARFTPAWVAPAPSGRQWKAANSTFAREQWGLESNDRSEAIYTAAKQRCKAAFLWK